jgi:hypothetical protein
MCFLIFVINTHLHHYFVWLVADAGLFWEISIAGWLLVVGLFWEKSTAGWWLIRQANRVQRTRMGRYPETNRLYISQLHLLDFIFLYLVTGIQSPHVWSTAVDHFFTFDYSPNCKICHVSWQKVEYEIPAIDACTARYPHSPPLAICL